MQLLEEESFDRMAVDAFSLGCLILIQDQRLIQFQDGLQSGCDLYSKYLCFPLTVTYCSSSRVNYRCTVQRYLIIIYYVYKIRSEV